MSRRILLIEDSPVVAPYTVDVLTELGFTVIGTRSEHGERPRADRQ